MDPTVLKENAGLEQRHLSILQETRVSCYTGGPESGQPVVLLHGGGTDHAMLSWRQTIPALLEAGYRIYTFDYPGYGKSNPDSSPSTVANLILYLEELMNKWSLDRASLVGISLGGAVAIGYTLANPGRVNRLVLVGTYGIQDKAPGHFFSYLLTRMNWVNRASWSLVGRSRWMARYSLKSIIRNKQSLTESLLDEVIEAINISSSYQAFSQFQRDEIHLCGIKTNYSKRLAEINAPVLLVHGDADIGVPLKYACRAEKLFKNAHLEVFEGAGHWLQRDYPQLFNNLLVKFLPGVL